MTLDVGYLPAATCTDIRFGSRCSCGSTPHRAPGGDPIAARLALQPIVTGLSHISFQSAGAPAGVQFGS